MAKLVNAVPDGSIYIDNTRGQLTIIGWDKPQISVAGELDDSARKLVFKQKGRKALIKVLMRGGRHTGHGSELTVHVPKASSIRFKGVDTAFYLSGLQGRIDGHTINGSLTVKDVQAQMKLSSVSGKVDVSQSSGQAMVESVSGKVKFSGAFEQAKLRSMSGNIMANINQMRHIKIENVSGHTVVDGNLMNNAKVELNSVSGDIHYQAKGELNAECEVASQFGGRILNSLTGDKAHKTMLHQRKLNFVSGDGSGKLVMNTVSGSVTLDK